MASPQTILYCRCAHADALPADVKEAVLAGLAESGAALEAVADLCELAARQDPALRRLAGAEGLQIVACHPRAVKGLFARAAAPLRDDAVIHNMRAESAGEILSRLARPGPAAGRTPGPRPVFPAKKPGEWVAWFPVIDYQRCRDCKQCLEFCLFGTYDLDEAGKVRVARPAKCKLNCPACARVCPTSAIIFPKFTGGGPIAGDEGTLAESAEQGMKTDLARLGKGDAYETLRQRAARAKAAAEAKYPKDQADR